MVRVASFLAVIGLIALGAECSPAHAEHGNPGNGAKSIDHLLKRMISGKLGHKKGYSKLLSTLENIEPAATPKTIGQIKSRLARIHSTVAPTGYFKSSAALISEGIASNDLPSLAGSYEALNNPNNVNPREPSSPVYPKKSPSDATYAQTEAEMRQQIYIPTSFTYGQKPPVILVPGTGERGGSNFGPNYIKLLSGQPYADVVWINPPGYQLADAQTNAETVAYAINYISGISNNHNVSVLGWSQGSISIHWAVKYWPSARQMVSDAITFSGDYHGTVAADLDNPLGNSPGVPLPPSLLQQKYNADFIKALRNKGGDSAYVPTTNMYSGVFDEIVEPQQDPIASGSLSDARGVGVSNSQVQRVCGPNTPAGGFQDHESMLYDALAYALVVDALTHDGPGRPSRIDLATVCQQAVAPGLTPQDVLDTEATIPFATFQIAVYNPKVAQEPAIRPYAQ